ncbi:MAG: helix-turn-helix transcriptional regulator [Candidatus Latescibacteria bacterium]|nr:helix-turn-helix transcriptional regulator [Candidatus Latescibacterota bacterium]
MAKENSVKRIDAVGRRIRTLRLARNMSIEDLSKKTSVSSVTISNIEKGVYSPKLSTVIEIAKALGTTITFLVEDVDHPHIFKIEKNKQRLVSADGVTLHDFGPVMMDKRVSIYLMEMDQGMKTSQHDSFDGNEFVHVLSGRISVDIEDRNIPVDEGESLYFHGSYHHILKADKKSKIIFVSIYT